MKKKIIYIMGAGRSGTTLLDIVIGNAQGVFSCGELVRYPELQALPHGFAPDTETYRFWGRVTAVFNGRFGGVPDYGQLESMVSRVDYHRSFLPNLLGLLPRRIVAEYRRYTMDLYDSIFECIDEPVIVDSSKYPSRALAVAALDKYDVCVVYLVRHPAMVAASFAKKGIEQPSKNLFSFNLYYFLVNLACSLSLARLRGRRTIKIRYEDLLSDPLAQLDRMENALSIDLSRVKELLAAGQPLDVGRLFEGNRIRLQQHLTVRTGGQQPQVRGIKARITWLLNGLWW